jgi:multiple sugar transport system substrate-binding protein
MKKLAAACLALTALVAGGCGGGSGSANGKTAVTFANWAAAEPATAPGIAAMIKKFEALHPKITIKSEPISFTDIEHQLVLEVQSGNPPDVAELQGNYLYTLAATSDLQPLGSYANGAFSKSVIGSELKLGELGGQLDAIPWTVGPIGLWYNKAVMKQAGLKPAPPASWDQLLSDAKAIHKKLPKVIVLGMDTTSRAFALDAAWPVMTSFGAVPFSGATATGDTPAMQSYLSFMRTLARDGYTPEGQKTGFFRQPAASNQVAFTVDGPYVKGVAQSINHMSDQRFYQTWGVAPLPTGSTGQHYSTPTDHQLVMFKNSANKTAAWQFMRFLATSQYSVLNYTLKYENSIPPLASPPDAVAKELDNPITKSFVKSIIPEVIKPAWGARYSAAYLDVMAGIQKAMTSSAPISSVASGMQASLKSDLGG